MILNQLSGSNKNLLNEQNLKCWKIVDYEAQIKINIFPRRKSLKYENKINISITSIVINIFKFGGDVYFLINK